VTVAGLAPILAATGVVRVLDKLGVVAVALLAAVVVLTGGRRAWSRWRAAALGAALILTPVLLIANIWKSPQLHPLRHHPALGVAVGVAGLAVVAVLAVAMYRRRELVPILALAALPFRIPIASGGTTSNLLVPLYLVIAAAALTEIVTALRSDPSGRPDPSGGDDRSGRAAPSERANRPERADPSERADADSRSPVLAGRLEWLLVGFVVLFAVQASYSSDFSKALQQVVFFYVPFALLFALLREVRWTRRLLVQCLGVAVGLAVIFVTIGFVEYGRHQLLLNPKVLASNQVQSYFRVNSLFFDPNIYGRFLAMVMISLAAVLLWTTDTRQVAVLAILLGFLWGGLLVSFSQSSFTALLLGLAVLGALRWSPRWTLGLTGVAVVVGIVVVLAAPRLVRFDVGSSQSANRATSGRYHLIAHGVELFAARPVYGYGSASFVREYRKRKHASSQGAASASHTIPITVAAEQGIIGLAVYLALLVAAFGRLFSGARGSVARMALAAAFSGLVLHTFLYADFLEDPVTWTLLGIGTALAWRARVSPQPSPAPARVEPSRQPA
jgi:O-antigen ligase